MVHLLGLFHLKKHMGHCADMVQIMVLRICHLMHRKASLYTIKALCNPKHFKFL